VVKTIVKLCTKTLPNIFNFDKQNDIQILTPMHRGEVGTINLNQVLQESLNPNYGIPVAKGIPFKSGDKVMQLKNNYQKGNLQWRYRKGRFGSSRKRDAFSGLFWAFGQL